MKQEALVLLNAHCEQVLGYSLESCRPVGLGGYDTLESLWPLNDIFRPHLHRLKTVRYKEQHEVAADEAIKNFVLNGDDWSSLSPVVLRVLLERHQQAILLCTANALADNPVVMYAPAELTGIDLTKFAIVFLWHSMSLPYPVTDESQLDIDAPFEHLSSRLH